MSNAAFTRLGAVGQSVRRLVARRAAHYRRKLHYRFPSIEAFNEPGTRARYNKHDLTENAALRVPDDEFIQVPCFWAVEVYGPTEIERLVDAFRRLGWDRELLAGASVLEWLSRLRTYGSLGSFNLGVVVRQKDRRPGMGDRVAELPEEFECAEGQVFQLTTSLTAVALRFVLKEGGAAKYAQALNRDHKTRLERQNGQRGYSIVSAFWGRFYEVDAIRKSFRESIRAWFSRTLPGHFSASEDVDSFPMAELLCSRESALIFRPFDRNETGRWREALTDGPFIEVWKSVDLDGLRMAWNDSSRRQRSHCFVGLETEKVTAKELGGHEPSLWSLAWCAGQHVEGALVHRAVIDYLIGLIRGIHEQRDSLPQHPRRHAEVLDALEQIQEFFSRTIGTPSIAAELERESVHAHWTSWRCQPFEGVRWRDGEKSSGLSEAFRMRTNSLAAQIATLDRETREHLEQLSTILNTRESVKAQRRMEKLTYWAIALAVASLVTSLFSLDRVSKWGDKKWDDLSALVEEIR